MVAPSWRCLYVKERPKTAEAWALEVEMGVGTALSNREFVALKDVILRASEGMEAKARELMTLGRVMVRELIHAEMGKK